MPRNALKQDRGTFNSRPNSAESAPSQTQHQPNLADRDPEQRYDRRPIQPTPKPSNGSDGANVAALGLKRGRAPRSPSPRVPATQHLIVNAYVAAGH